jgi:hypothetical protein
MSHQSLRVPTLPCLLLFIKGLIKESLGDFGGFFAFGFCLGFSLWAFWCGKLLEGKRITEGKRIAKGKLLKGKG